MKGSEKQVAWAQDIISKTLASLDEVMKVIEAQRDAATAKAYACEDEARRAKQIEHLKDFDVYSEGADHLRKLLAETDDAKKIIDNRKALDINPKDVSEAKWRLRDGLVRPTRFTWIS